MYERILVPLDRSRAAEAALGHAQAIAQKFDSQIILLHIHPDDGERGIAEADGYLQTLQTRLQKGGLRVETALKRGIAADRILQHASESGASLIVMSSHGLTAHENVLDTTVAHQVMASSHIPVLLIRPPAFRAIP